MSLGVASLLLGILFIVAYFRGDEFGEKINKITIAYKVEKIIKEYGTFYDSGMSLPTVEDFFKDDEYRKVLPNITDGNECFDHMCNRLTVRINGYAIRNAEIANKLFTGLEIIFKQHDVRIYTIMLSSIFIETKKDSDVEIVINEINKLCSMEDLCLNSEDACSAYDEMIVVPL